MAPDARLAVGRELTKRYEEVLAGAPADVLGRLDAPRGEFTVVISGLEPRDEASNGLDPTAVAASAASAGLSHRSIVDVLRAGGLSRREAYDLASQAGKPRVTGR